MNAESDIEVALEEPAATNEPGMPTYEAFDDLCRRANAGDHEAQLVLKQTLRDNPQIWQVAGDLGRVAENALIEFVAKANVFFGDAVRMKLAALRQELAGPTPTALERLAVQRVLATWLHLFAVELQCAEVEGEIDKASFWLKRQAQAERLHQQSLRTLTLVQRLRADSTPGQRTASAPGQQAAPAVA